MTYFGDILPVFRGQVRKLFITSLVLYEFSCGEVHIPCLCKQQMNIEVFCVNARCNFLHNLEQRHSVFAQGECLCSRLC